jgi:hypothetical protein
MESFVHISTFNSKLLDIVIKLLNKFPNDINLEYTKTQIELAKQLNSKLPALHFINEVSQHLDELDKRDETFFLSLVKSKYDDVLSSMDIPHKWTCLTKEEQNYLWTTTQSLVKLGTLIRNGSL